MIFAGAGFAAMAIELANERSTRGILLRPETGPAPRGHWRSAPGYPSAEYYRIVDDVTERWNRLQNEVRLGAKPIDWRMKL